MNEISRKPAQTAAPSTVRSARQHVRPFARDPRVLVGWPFPFSVGFWSGRELATCTCYWHGQSGKSRCCWYSARTSKTTVFWKRAILFSRVSAKNLWVFFLRLLGVFLCFWGVVFRFLGVFLRCAGFFFAFHAPARFFWGSFFTEGTLHRNGEFPPWEWRGRVHG